jgi:uncharacterized membrane protein YraQ (UPF0718 family)
MKTFIKKYKLFLFLVIINFLLIIFYPTAGSKSVEISLKSLIEMFIIVPPIFLLLGLFDIWVPRETIVKLMGEQSGLLGLSLALLLGSFSAGPLYAAFPVAAMLMNKGCKLSNILLFIGAWATTKIPMLLFEAGSMGWPFMLTRLLINIPGIIIMAYIVEMFVSYEEKEVIYQRGLSF